jgi:hypothetical protein
MGLVGDVMRASLRRLFGHFVPLAGSGSEDSDPTAEVATRRIEANRFLIDQTRAQVADQWARLEGFRSKSFVSLGVFGTIAAFFGGKLPGASSELQAAEIVAFVTTGVFAILLVLPKKFSHGIGPAAYRDWLCNKVASGQDPLPQLLDAATRSLVGRGKRTNGDSVSLQNSS